MELFLLTSWELSRRSRFLTYPPGPTIKRWYQGGRYLVLNLVLKISLSLDVCKEILCRQTWDWGVLVLRVFDSLLPICLQEVTERRPRPEGPTVVPEIDQGDLWDPWSRLYPRVVRLSMYNCWEIFPWIPEVTKFYDEETLSEVSLLEYRTFLLW